jgi:hypothetical protein
MKENHVKNIVILGMHRSGTSMVAGILTKLGINMGDELLGKTPSNPFGHFEDRDFVNLNNSILLKAKGSWDEPPSEKDILSQADDFNNEIQKLIKKKSDLRNIWGWKDPRTSLTIKLYIPYLKNPYFIICHRKNTEIANSLKRRDGYEIKKGLDLVNIYNNRIDNFFNQYENLNKIDLDYEDFLNNPEQNIVKLIDFLYLDVGKERIVQLSNFVKSKESIKKVSKKLSILNTFKFIGKGFTRPWKIPLFIYRRLKK